MADLTFKLWQDQAMTQALPNFDGWPVIRVDYNGVETKTGVLYCTGQAAQDTFI